MSARPPSREPDGGAPDAPRSVSFRERLRERHGVGVDPHVSLDPEPDVAPTETAPGAGPERARSPASSVLSRLMAGGDTAGRYAYKGEIARGGMGAIVKVWDEDFRRTLAMKVILGRGDSKEGSGEEPQLDERRLTRFLEEAQITGQLDHPGIVPVHELGLDGAGRVYFTMRLIKGRDLEKVFEQVRTGERGWSQTRALGVILRVCEAMAFAHEKGVVHRDIKPANVMVGRFGETYVMDWGLAKVMGREDSHDLRLRDTATALSLVRTDRRDAAHQTPDSPLVTMDGDIMGTPCYMPPEQARGNLEEIGPHSDVYSVGALLYELLTGWRPYVEPGQKPSPQAVLTMLLHGPPRAIHAIDRNVPSELTAICEKAMARRAEERYPNMLAMAEDLRAFLEGRVVRAYETGPVAEFRKWIARNKGAAASAAAALLLAVGGVTAFAWSQAEAKADAIEANTLLEEERRKAVESEQLARDNESRVLEANRKLERLNWDLAQATREAREKEREASLLKHAADLANANLAKANEASLESARLARRLGYAAHLAAAEASLRNGDAAEARRRLELCEEDVRHWEWRRLALLSDASLRVIQGTDADALAVDFSPDGSRIAAAYDDGSLRVHGALDGDVELELAGHGVRAMAVAWSPDGERLLSTAYDGGAILWNPRTGAPMLRPSPETGHQRPVTAAAWSPDGSRFATGSVDRTARIWDARTGAVLHTLEGHDEAVTDLHFGLDGASLASGAADGGVRVWSVESGAVVFETTVRRSSASFVRMMPDGFRLAAGFGAVDRFSELGAASSRGNAVYVWDLRTGESLDVLWGHSGPITAGDLRADGRQLITGSADTTLRLWDLELGRALALHGSGATIGSVTMSADGRLVASTSHGRSVRVWDAEAGLALDLAGHHRSTFAVAFLPWDGLVASGSADGTLRIWDPVSGGPLAVLDVQAEMERRGHRGLFVDMAVDASARRLATVSGGAVALWDPATGEVARVFAEEGRAATACATSADGLVLVIGMEDGAVRAIDVPTGATIVEFTGHEGRVLDVAVDSIGHFVASCAEDDTTRLWDVDLEEESETLLAGQATPQAVALGPDASVLAAACDDGTVRTWRTDTGEALHVLRGHVEEARAVAFSADGARLASGSDDGSVRVWDVRSGEALLAVRDGLPRVLAVAFDGDADTVAAGTFDGGVRLWPTAPTADRYRARHAALALRARALEVLAPLFEELVQPGAVVARVEADGALTPEVRALAVRMARLVGDDLERIQDDCWSALVDGGDAEACRRALWGARIAVEREPGDERAHRLLGMARFRAGDLDRALAALNASEELQKFKRRRPEVVAFLAMVHARRGEIAAADSLLEELSELMRVPMVMRNRDIQSLQREAETLRTLAGR